MSSSRHAFPREREVSGGPRDAGEIAPQVDLLASGYGLIEGPVWEPARGLMFSDVLNGGVYCLERDPKPRIYRLYIPGQDTPDETIRRQVEERTQQTLGAGPLASWARSRERTQRS